MKRARRCLLGLISSFACLVMVTAATPVGGAPVKGFPSLRLFAESPDVIVTRFKGQAAPLDLGIYLTPVGGPFEVDARRAGYKEPIALEQVLRQGGSVQSRALPSSLLDGWNGLSRMLRLVATDDNGKVVAHFDITTCLDTWDEQRVDDSGPQNPTFPSFCLSNPFMKGAVWGIDSGWGINPLSMFGRGMRVPDGHYTVTVSLTKRFVYALGIAPADASVAVGVEVATTSGCERICPPPASHRSRRSHRTSTAAARMLTSLDQATEPDLIPLPAWGITLDHRGKRDFLDFGATVWDAGPAPMVIEGFRRRGSNVMDAFQYLYRDGSIVGKAPAGTLLYDPRPGHEHWHFQQFAAYRLLDSAKSNPIISHKEAFCLAPTDGIDLTVPGAEWNPESVGFFSQCGQATSIWTRETLPAGWGDTYFQGLPGQSFNITNLANGTYFIQVQANPMGVIHEGNTSNDTTYRKVILGGKPGARTLRVPPWNGIDG